MFTATLKLPDLVEEIDSLMTDLASSRELTRRRAREALVAIGKPAIAPLMATLTDPNVHVRWEAVKALEDIGDPEVAGALVNVLENEKDGSIRWLAAEGLIHLKREGLPLLLQALVHHSDSAWLKEEAHYVLRSLAKNDPDLNCQLSTVLAAMENTKLVIQIPPAAQAAYDALTETTAVTMVEEMCLD